MKSAQITRREFLQSSGALVVGVSGVLPSLDALAQNAAPKILGPNPSQLDTWIKIGKDGLVTINSGKMDCGQGLDVAYSQIAAEELDVPLHQVVVLFGDTRYSVNQGGGSASSGIRQGAIPVRNAAAEARRVLVGMAAQELQTTPDQLDVLNALVHPITIAAAADWFAAQNSPYVLKEAALIFEAGASVGLDYVIGVFAPTALRIKRVMDRDHLSREDVLSRMNRQIDDQLKMKLCDFVIQNNNQALLTKQVLELHEKFLKLSNTNS